MRPKSLRIAGTCVSERASISVIRVCREFCGMRVYRQETTLGFTLPLCYKNKSQLKHFQIFTAIILEWAYVLEPTDYLVDGATQFERLGTRAKMSKRLFRRIHTKNELSYSKQEKASK